MAVTSVDKQKSARPKVNNILAQAESLRADLPREAAPVAIDGYRSLTKPIVGDTDVRHVSIAALRYREHGQVRTGDPARTESFEELVSSIRTLGVMQPISVSWDEASQCFWVDVGHRRTAAARVAGLTSIPAVIRKRRDRPSDRSADLTTEQLIENVHRLDLPALDVAQAIEALIRSGMTAVQIARKVGKSEAWLSQHRKVLELDPELLDDARRAGLGTSVLYLIAQEKHLSREQQRELLEAAKRGRPELQRRLDELKVTRERVAATTLAAKAGQGAATGELNAQGDTNSVDPPASTRALRGAARRLLGAAGHMDTLLAASGEHDAIRHSISNLCELLSRELGVR